MDQNEKRAFFKYSRYVIKKDPTTSIRNHANELKVHKRTEEEDLSSDHTPLDYAIRGILEKKT